MLNEQDKKEVRDRLAQMTESVRLIFFTQQLAGTCQYCTETERLLKEVTELSDKLDLEINNFVTDKEKVDVLGIDKIPATAINSTEDHGIRFYGIPTGYEFATFLEAILRVSAGDSGLPDNLKKHLEEIVKPVHILVFVTPTCPYCTRAAFTAIQMALENTNITSDIIEVTEFPQLGQKYGVMGVPKVVINEDHRFEGALPEHLFVEHVLEAVK
jgi:glutaredoxin-like protein